MEFPTSTSTTSIHIIHPEEKRNNKTTTLNNVNEFSGHVFVISDKAESFHITMEHPTGKRESRKKFSKWAKKAEIEKRASQGYHKIQHEISLLLLKKARKLRASIAGIKESLKLLLRP